MSTPLPLRDRRLTSGSSLGAAPCPKAARAILQLRLEGVLDGRLAESCELRPEEVTTLLALGRYYRLTPVQRERLIEMACGLSNAEMAARHDISLNTVKTEVAAVLGSLGLKCRHQLEMLAEQLAYQLAAGDGSRAVAAGLRHGPR